MMIRVLLVIIALLLSLVSAEINFPYVEGLNFIELFRLVADLWLTFRGVAPCNMLSFRPRSLPQGCMRIHVIHWHHLPEL